MNARQSLVGRDGELRRIEACLAAGPGVTVVVTGPFGTGKTTLVRAVRESAAEAGWLLAPADRDAIVIGPDCTVETAWSTIVDEVGESVRRRTTGQSFVTAKGATRPSGDRHDAAVTSLLTGAQLTPDDAATGGATAWPGGAQQVGPALITVDVQAPAPEVRDWLSRGVLRDLGEQAAPALILTSDRPEDQQCLQPMADLVIALGPLDRSAVLDRLARTRPGLPVDELAAYADAVSRDPSLLDSFLRLLPLISVESWRADGPPEGP
jgi:AAA ATPase domain